MSNTTIVIWKRSHFVLGLALLLVVSSCDLIKKIKELTSETIPNTTEKAIGVLDNAIDALNVNSADWQNILQKAIDELPTEVQSTITNEVSNLLSRTVSAAGAEVRCDVDFFGVRVQQGLQRIKAKLLGSELPPLEPQLCNIVPLAIDMSLEANRRNKLEFYGYDFDMTSIKVILASGSNETDVTRFLDQPTHYHMTLNLGGSGVALNASSTRLILQWGGRNISTIAVIQPSPDICETSFDDFDPANISYMPPLVEGDREFNGHGPNSHCSVVLTNKGSSIEASVYFKARETRSDWTTGEGTKKVTIYTADPGKTIDKIVGATSASFSYIDNDHALDAFAGSGPVHRFVFMGDGSGNDIGSNTKVEIEFNPLRVQLKETGDCVPSATIRSLELSGDISTKLLNRTKKMNKTMKFMTSDEFKSISIDTVRH